MSKNFDVAPRRFLNLEALRLFAASNVVFFHLIGALNSRGITFPLGDFFEGWGASGVDIFFVISGFVIWTSYQNSKPNFRVFIVARLRRIVPIYWILTIAAITIVLVAPSLFGNTILSPKWVIGSMFFVSAPLGYSYPILYQGWSLEYEMLFYGLVAVSLLLFPRRNPWLFTVVGLLVIITLQPNFVIVIDFILGLFAAFLYARFGDKISVTFFWVLFSLGVSTYLGTLFTNFDFGLRVLFFGVPGFILVLGLSGIPQLKSKQWAKLGFASYSIYLLQWFSVPLVTIAIVSLNQFVSVTEIVVLPFLAALIVSGYFFSEWVDKPIYKYLLKIGNKFNV